MKKQTKKLKDPWDIVRVTSRDKTGKVIYLGRFVWERHEYVYKWPHALNTHRRKRSREDAERIRQIEKLLKARPRELVLSTGQRGSPLKNERMSNARSLK